MKTFEIPRNNYHESALLSEQLGYDSWRRSAWIRGLAYDNCTTADLLAADIFNPADPDLIEKQARKLENAHEIGSRTVAMFGSSKPNKKPDSFILLEAEYDFTDTSLQTRLDDFIVISSIFAKKAASRSGITTLLAEGALAHVPQDLHLSFFTAYDNMAMRKWGERYGFFTDTTNEYEQTFSNNIKVPYLRYIIDTVGLARQNMREARPELFS